MYRYRYRCRFSFFLGLFLRSVPFFLASAPKHDTYISANVTSGLRLGQRYDAAFLAVDPAAIWCDVERKTKRFEMK